MTNDNTVPVHQKSAKARASQADFSKLEMQVVRLTTLVSQLEMKLAAKDPTDSTLPMTREHFMALAVIAGLQSGGWTQLKYTKQRAGAAYEEWVKACKPDPFAQPAPEPEAAAVV